MWLMKKGGIRGFSYESCAKARYEAALKITQSIFAFVSNNKAVGPPKGCLVAADQAFAALIGSGGRALRC